MAESSYYPIYAKEAKDVPEWMRKSHEWQAAVTVDKLPKYQLKVKLCCQKCAEKVEEEIREVHGVFDVRVERFHSKVVVVASTPSGLDEHEVLRKARKVNRKAKFVELDDKEKPKKGDDNKKKEEEKKKKEEEEKKKKEKEEAERKQREAEFIYTFKPFMHWGPSPYYTPLPYYTVDDDEKKKEEEKKKKEKEEAEKKLKEAESFYTFKPLIHWGPSPYHTPVPVAYTPDEYYPSQNYAPRYQYPPFPGQPEDGYFRQYVYYH